MNQPNILLVIYFEKALDSRSHEFLYQVLQKMGFGPNFQAVYWTDTFFVKRGVRQGGPLSPLLFILALETLVCQIREKNIKGFLVNGKEIKTTLFADDMTCFLRDTNSYFQPLTSLQNYARYSGLCINNEKKNRDFAIGPHSRVQDVFTHKIGSMIKLLGLYFNYDNGAQRARACSPIANQIYPSSKIW